MKRKQIMKIWDKRLDCFVNWIIKNKISHRYKNQHFPTVNQKIK